MRQAVESALAQRGASKEVIVVDDGSTDGSRGLLRQYAGRIELIELEENCGAIAARNAGVARCCGKYIAFLDGDDVLMPWALDVYNRLIIERNPKIILGSSTWFTTPEPPAMDGHEPQKIEFVSYKYFMAKDRPCGLSASLLVVERKAFCQAGAWTPGIFHLDLVDLAAKLGYCGTTVQVSQPPTAFYRFHAGNSIQQVPPFVNMAHRLLEKERAGAYPGGPERRLERYAWFGGMVVFWIKRAMRSGLYAGAAGLIADGWPMVLAAVKQRTIAWLLGRAPMENVALKRIQS